MKKKATEGVKASIGLALARKVELNYIRQISELQQSVYTLTGYLTQLREILSTINTEHLDEITGLKTEINSNKTSLDTQTSANQVLEQRVDSLKKKVSEKRKALKEEKKKRLPDAYTNLEKRYENLKATLMNTEDELTRLRKDYDGLYKAYGETKELAKKLHDEKHQSTLRMPRT